MQLKRGSPVRLLFGATATLLVVLLIVQAQLHVSAHAALERSNPEADAVVTKLPEDIELIFTQEIDSSGTEIRILAPDGSRVASPAASPASTPSQAAG